MKTPTNLKDFVEANKSKTFYYAYRSHSKSAIIEVSPLRQAHGSQYVRWSSPNWDFNDSILPFEDIYERPEEASFQNELYTRMCANFQRPMGLPVTLLKAHYEDLLALETAIAVALSDHPGYDGVDFHETFDNKIQIRTFHKGLPDHVFGVSVFMKPDFSDSQEAFASVVAQFKANDTSEQLAQSRSFFSHEDLSWD